MVAPWFLLFLDFGGRLLLAGGGGEATDLLAEPAVNCERIQNTVGCGNASFKSNSCNRLPDLVLSWGHRVDILCGKRQACMLRSGDSRGTPRCSMPSSCRAIAKSRSSGRATRC